jgi:hypothetical protein
MRPEVATPLRDFAKAVDCGTFNELYRCIHKASVRSSPRFGKNNSLFEGGF